MANTGPGSYNGAIPFRIAAVLTYSAPGFGYGAKLAWAYATYDLLNMGYTLIIQPYIPLATIMTADPRQRTRLQSIRMMCAQSGGVIVALAIPLLTGWLWNWASRGVGRCWPAR